MFESASIALNPKHGTLKQTAELNFVYQPNANYKGTDEYSLKICGQKTSGKGCSTINYKTTIQ